MIRKLTWAVLLLLGAFAFASCEDEEAQKRQENYERVRPKAITQQELENMGTLKDDEIYLWFSDGKICFYNSNSRDAKYEIPVKKYTYKLEGFVATAYEFDSNGEYETFKFNLFRCQETEVWIANNFTPEGISDGTINKKYIGHYKPYSPKHLFEK